MAQLANLAFQSLDPLPLRARGARPKALVALGLPHPLPECLGGTSNLGCNRGGWTHCVQRQRLAAHCEAWSPPCSSTIRTARCRISGEYLFDVFFVMAPSSQELEPPENPGRFIATLGERIAQIEARIDEQHRANPVSRLIATIPGIGPITATAIATTVPAKPGWRSRPGSSRTRTTKSRDQTSLMSVLSRPGRASPAAVQALFSMQRRLGEEADDERRLIQL